MTTQLAVDAAVVSSVIVYINTSGLDMRTSGRLNRRASGSLKHMHYFNQGRLNRSLATFLLGSWSTRSEVTFPRKYKTPAFVLCRSEHERLR